MSALASEQVLQFGPSTQTRVFNECAGPDPWLSARFEPDFLVPVQFFDLTRRRKNQARNAHSTTDRALRIRRLPESESKGRIVKLVLKPMQT